jgi:type VI secretion system protein VasJ
MNLPDLGISPITADNPSGEDIRYQPVFEDLQAEVDKLSSPSAAAESIDWKKVSTLAAEILSSQSKDLLVAAYFCVAQIHLARIQGLELGLQVYAGLLENFWESLFPQMRRMRGRIAAIEWWIEKSESAIKQILPETIDDSAKERIHAQCGHIDQILAQYLPDSPPAIHSIMRAVDEIPSGGMAPPAAPPAEKPAPEVLEAPEFTASSPPQQSSQPAPPPVDPSLSRPEAESTVSMDSLLRSLHHTATTLLEQDIENPLPYRLLRLSAWSTIDELPPVVDGKTLVPPPDPQTTAILQDLFSRGEWNSVVTAAEYQLPEYIFWLDLNRLSATALEHLGPSCQRASECVIQETGFFLARFPGLDALRFSDGTPFADKDTQDWLQSISLGGTAQPIVPMTEGNACDPLSARLTEAMKQAQSLVKEKNLIDAVALFQQEMRLAFPAKDKMLWRLALCRILIHSKNVELAVPHFDRMLEDIETHRLEEWDPNLALQSLKVIWAGFQKVQDKNVKERAVFVLHKIARLDPVEALRLGK